MILVLKCYFFGYCCGTTTWDPSLCEIGKNIGNFTLDIFILLAQLWSHCGISSPPVGFLYQPCLHRSRRRFCLSDRGSVRRSVVQVPCSGPVPLDLPVGSRWVVALSWLLAGSFVGARRRAWPGRIKTE